MKRTKILFGQPKKYYLNENIIQILILTTVFNIFATIFKSTFLFSSFFKATLCYNLLEHSGMESDKALSWKSLSTTFCRGLKELPTFINLNLSKKLPISEPSCDCFVDDGAIIGMGAGRNPFWIL